MPNTLAETNAITDFQILSMALSFVSMVFALAWFALRLYIGNQLFKLKEHIDEKFNNLGNDFVRTDRFDEFSKRVESHDRRLTALEQTRHNR